MMKLLRFGLVGVLATTVHIAVALSLVSGLAWALPAANVLAYGVALLVSYTGHSLWVFRHPLQRRRFLLFVLVNSVSLVVIAGLSWLAEYYQLDPELAVVLIALLVPLVSFGLHSRITFSPAAPAGMD